MRPDRLTHSLALRPAVVIAPLADVAFMYALFADSGGAKFEVTKQIHDHYGGFKAWRRAVDGTKPANGVPARVPHSTSPGERDSLLMGMSAPASAWLWLEGQFVRQLYWDTHYNAGAGPGAPFTRTPTGGVMLGPVRQI